MWSLSLFTMATIFMAAFCSEVSMARRTLIRSASRRVSTILERVSKQLTSLGARSGNDDLDDPFFPAYLFLRLVGASKSSEPCSGHARLPPLTIE